MAVARLGRVQHFVAHRSEDPALRDLHAELDRLIARTPAGKSVAP